MNGDKYKIFRQLKNFNEFSVECNKQICDYIYFLKLYYYFNILFCISLRVLINLFFTVASLIQTSVGFNFSVSSIELYLNFLSLQLKFFLFPFSAVFSSISSSISPIILIDFSITVSRITAFCSSFALVLYDSCDELPMYIPIYFRVSRFFCLFH